MKSSSILFAFVLSIGLFSTFCNSSDSNEGDTLAPIAGKWDIVKVGTNINGV